MEVLLDEAAEAFKTHFLNISESLNVQNVKDSSLPLHFISKQFSSHQHNSNNRSRDTKYNNSLKSKGSSGYVKMSNKIMWNTNYKPLSYISSKSVSVGICPMSQIYANVKPLYKKVCNSSMANYRPMFFFGDIFKNSWDNNVLQINHYLHV